MISGLRDEASHFGGLAEFGRDLAVSPGKALRRAYLLQGCNLRDRSGDLIPISARHLRFDSL